MPSPPPSKKQKPLSGSTATSPNTAFKGLPATPQQGQAPILAPKQPHSNANAGTFPDQQQQGLRQQQQQQSPSSPSNPRKRRASASPKFDTLPPGTSLASDQSATTPTSQSVPALLGGEDSSKKRGRTNTPWTAQEEQRLKQMRDAGHSWSEIAKAFPARTEGSVKKHWYKDMHYAEFAEDESVALREAIREYEANKWKAIGQKLGKPAKACEQYAKEHFKNG
ncbi:hypothetical protein ABEF91_005568 [Exophiala dermatitidis]